MSAETTSGGQGGEARFWLGTWTTDRIERGVLLFGPSEVRGDYRVVDLTTTVPVWAMGDQVTDLREAVVLEDRDHDAFDHAIRVAVAPDGRWSWMCDTCGAHDGPYRNREDAASDADEPQLHGEPRRAPQPTPAREAPTDDAAPTCRDGHRLRLHHGAPGDRGCCCGPDSTGEEPDCRECCPSHGDGPTDDAALVEEVAREIENALVAYPMRAVVTDGVAQLVVDRGLSAYIARAVIPVVTRAVAGRARREALMDARWAVHTHRFDHHRPDFTGPDNVYRGMQIAEDVLADLAAPATDDTGGNDDDSDYGASNPYGIDDTEAGTRG